MALMTWPLTSDGVGAVTFTANDWRTIVTNLFTEGTLGTSSFLVAERALGANMTLDIAAGVAVLTGDDAANQGRYLVRENAATLSAVTIGTAHATLPRIDLVGIQLRDPSEGGAAGRNSIFAVTAGTAAASPVAPTAPDSFLVLASVLVPAAAVSIVDADITDLRTHAQLAHVDVIGAGDIATAMLADASVTNIKIAAAVGGTVGTIRYRKLGNMVTLWGSSLSGDTIPAGYRPSATVFVPSFAGGGPAANLVEIATSGVVSTAGGGLPWHFVASYEAA